MDQKKTVRPFSMKDKIGYTLGDLGSMLYLHMIIMRMSARLQLRRR